MIGFSGLDLLIWLLPVHSCLFVTMLSFIILQFFKGSINVSRHDAD